MIELFLCDARQQIRSIVGLCEKFGVRRTRAKRVNQNDFIISVRRQGHRGASALLLPTNHFLV